MAKKQQNVEQTPLEKQYPRYISNHPKGEDMFEGKSQERLAQAVAAHIVGTDEGSKSGVKPAFARLIGLEGKWGSGKSNVIKILEEELNKNGSYTFFTFDAWGNQEDLQRRSILELLTRHLMRPEVNKLTGMTTMRVMRPEGEGKIDEIECTWLDKLNSLLSRKSYSRDITVPSLNNWTKIFVLLLLVTGMLIPLVDVVAIDLSRWAQLAIILAPIIVFLIIAAIRKKLGEMWKMYNTKGKSDTTSYVISEQEPSVREFKEWMTEISNGIPKTETLVLVFDNMDRLPSEKVHQFWSLIQTFFADDGYPNIWCIIPYDESHLAAVFSSEDATDKSIKLLRGFLDKTFPVSYRVPEPIVADYKNIFEKLFREAFGTTIDDDRLELISQCYRHEHPVPNVREIISFINNNVKFAKQWKEIINPISRAIYILKEDALLRHPQLPAGTDRKYKDVSTDEYILANEYYRSFNQLLFGKVDLNDTQREVAAMVYGVEPENAAQIVVNRYIRNCVSGTDKYGSLDKYVDTPHFMLLLEEYVKNMSINEYANAATLIQAIDAEKLADKDKKRLAKIWHHFGNQFVALDAPVKEVTDYSRIVFSHVAPALAEQCVAAFCKRLIDNSKEVNGSHLYEQLTVLFNETFAKGLEIRKVCPVSTIDSKRFADYVLRAGDNYKRFPLRANADELNQTIEKAIDKSFPYLEVLKDLKDDKDYTVAEVGKFSVQQFNLKKSSALVAQHLIAIQRVFYSSFQSTQDANYNTALWQEVKTEEGKTAYDEIFALKSVGVYEQLPEDERHINILLPRVLFYTSTTKLLKDYLSNPNIHFRRNLLKKMIETKKHDGNPDYPEFIEHWQFFVYNIGLERQSLIQFADDWGYKHISEQEQDKTYFNLLSDTAWIDALLAESNPLAKALLTKCVAEMVKQPNNQFVQANTASRANSPWSIALGKLIDTDYITTNNLGNLKGLAVEILDFVARNGAFNDDIWNSLLAKVEYSSISSQVSDIRNHILNGVKGYSMTHSKFKILHRWLEQSGINATNHCDDAANQILAKVVEDLDCQQIILKDKDYYKPIIANTVETASSLHDKLKVLLNNNPYSEFAGYIRETVRYSDEEKGS